MPCVVERVIHHQCPSILQCFLELSLEVRESLFLALVNEQCILDVLDVLDGRQLWNAGIHHHHEERDEEVALVSQRQVRTLATLLKPANKQRWGDYITNVIDYDYDSC